MNNRPQEPRKLPELGGEAVTNWVPMDRKFLIALKTGDKRQIESLLSWDPICQEPMSVPVHYNGMQLGTNYLKGSTYGGNTALHIAACNGDVKIAEMIYRRETLMLAARNKMMETPFHCAARSGDKNMMSKLILLANEEGRYRLETLMRAKNQHGETALHEAIREHKIDVVRLLLHEDNHLADAMDERGVSPLYLAAMLGFYDVVIALMQAMPGGPTSKASYAGPYQQTVLHILTQCPYNIGNGELAMKILEWNPTIAKEMDSTGNTALHYAVAWGNTILAKVLLEHDASLVYIPDPEGLFPIHIAAKKGHISLIDMISERCLDTDELLDDKGRNYLHIAVVEKQWKIVHAVCQKIRKFCQELKLVNARDYEGNTVLHLPVKSKDQRILTILLDTRGVRADIMNYEGRTALDLAIEGRDSGQYFNLVIRRGAIRPDNLLHATTTKDPRAEQITFDNVAQLILIASVLIATVTFAAIFTLPGGYRSDDDPMGESIIAAFVLGIYAVLEPIADYPVIVLVLATSFHVTVLAVDISNWQMFYYIATQNASWSQWKRYIGPLKPSEYLYAAQRPKPPNQELICHLSRSSRRAPIRHHFPIKKSTCQ
ncbi:hypothetical protein LUZ61_010156 [Rhynchospora tenuis]|uniref:PGG domain-containing protein n=1 Tax=Rhynchospora tenuis TaxID=198213 RepID=A0AAD6EZ05_9POAL|nr:hypothetical protein LUZ61_010156 [Rhynchospora tenuis]